MFSNLLLLIITLLLINLGQEITIAPLWEFSPAAAFLLGKFAYLCLLSIIYLQNIYFKKFLRNHKGRMLILVNVELIAFLCLYYFVLGSHRFFETIPFLGISTTIANMFALGLYLGGLAVFHFSASHRSKDRKLDDQSRWSTAILEMRMLVPFTLPFLLFTFLLDLIQLYPDPQFHEMINTLQDTPLGILFTILSSTVFIIGVMILLPPVIQWFWKCKPLEESPLLDKINALCKKAHFKNGGIKTWGVMNQSLTAAIIGIIPCFRYIIFTKRLLREMEPEWIEAILSHEIGHNYRRHLVIYPFIIFGMIICTALFSLFFSDGIVLFFNTQMEQNPSPIWLTLFPITIFLSYAVIIILYFRFVFGFFSRLFERQADLHVFALGIEPEHMISALRYVGQTTGTLTVPNWHHYSIQQRLDFLEKASQNCMVITQHHRKVRTILILYFAWLIAMACLLIAPLFPDYPVFMQINNFTHAISSGISTFINES